MQGASFVRREQEENPAVVRGAMPALAEIEEMARELGMRVAVPSFLGSEPEQIARGMEDFYLAVLMWEGGEGVE